MISEKLIIPSDENFNCNLRQMIREMLRNSEGL